ncbi:MAG TPA: alpha/beta hydrolase fold domain-containing protein, partial [Microbacteriaceae bacterium]|nr:alpha/beta hydrolase fold domain-containing protein [Microbacteriaceae bacterium]
MAFPRPVADAIARLAQRGPGPRPGEGLRFLDLPVTTEGVIIPTRHGEVAATVISPEGGAAGRPVYVNFHGGGFVLRHPEQDDGLCRYLAVHAGVVVVNVDYDVAPQLRFPGPVEQAYDAVVWAASGERSWDGARLAVGGSSAGGALAAGAARLALELGAPAI